MKVLTRFAQIMLVSLLPFTHGKTVNEIADNIINQLGAGNKMIVLLAYVSGLGFLVLSFFKFKQHKDNPAQNPIGNPLTIMLIGLLLIYLANLSIPLGETFFGSDSGPNSGATLVQKWNS